MLKHTCSYCPDDDKLRLSPAGRLPADEYAEIKAAGFSWAPKQGVFYAIWTPAREALLLEWCGEIDDEDTSLVDRAEVRADRFTNYHERRTTDAERASAAADSIAHNIPFGQPILVGHHSEKRARKDAQKIENGMRYAIKMWDTAEYWQRRAAGAIATAKYKERADVRARRIKGLQADLRKRIKNQTEAQTALDMWNKPGLTLEQGRMLAGYSSCRLSVVKKDDGFYWSAYDVLQDDENRYKACPSRTLAEVIEAANRAYPRTIAHNQVWIDHINNRLEYEKAMLAEGGGLKSDGFDFAIGGKVKRRGTWHIITKLNKKAGVLQSVSVADIGWTTVKMEDVQDYQPPTEGETVATKKATAKAPICNYRGEIALLNRYHGTTDAARQTIEITQAEWNAAHSDYKGTRDVPATETTARHRVRIICRGGSYPPVFITDAKEKLPPAAEKEEIPRELPAVPHELPQQREYVASEPTKADELRKQLKAGIKVVSAPQLFPTPAPLAARMVEMAEIEAGMRVLEPSAGTGRIIQAIRKDAPDDISLIAIEINKTLLDMALTQNTCTGLCDDFLTLSLDDLGAFDSILMNPPFINGADIKHIKHAYELLKPGGRLVAICAGGPRQTEQLKPLCDTWEALPSGTFEESGTGVSTVLLTMNKPAEVVELPATVMECLADQPINAEFCLKYEDARYPDPARTNFARALQTSLF